MYLQIKRQSSTPMIKQLYQQLKNKILNGDLKSNERLPSSRKLAEELKISRIVIVEAYEMLSTEGYTKSVKGSGTFVSEAIAISRPTVKKPDSLPTEAWYKDLDLPISFRTGLAALDEFPRTKWLQCYKDAIYSMPESDLGYNLIIGHKDFEKHWRIISFVVVAYAAMRIKLSLPTVLYKDFFYFYNTLKKLTNRSLLKIHLIKLLERCLLITN